MPSETIERLAGRFREHRRRFEEFCRSLSEEELSRAVPDSAWIVKDFASHLGTLDAELIRWFDAVKAGRPEEPARNADGSPFDIDRWNGQRVAERHDWPLEQILEEAAGNRERFLRALLALTDEDIEKTMHFAGDNKRDPADIAFKLFLSGLSRHDPIHVAGMIKALPERAAEPAVREWLDDPVVQWYQTTMAGPARR